MLEVIKDLHAAGCSIVTIGQYLPPTSQHHRLDRYVTPEQFDAYAAYGTSLGLKHVFSARWCAAATTRPTSPDLRPIHLQNKSGFCSSQWL